MTLLDGEVAQRVPLQTDGHGVVRVRGTRVSLETVVGAYRRGERPEDIVASYDSLKLADVYTVIAYYLAHRKEVDDYLAERQQAAQVLRAQIEADPRMSQFRARLHTLKAGRQMPGVVVIGEDAPIGPIVDDILLLAGASQPAEWEGQVVYLPL